MWLATPNPNAPATATARTATASTRRALASRNVARRLNTFISLWTLSTIAHLWTLSTNLSGQMSPEEERAARRGPRPRGTVRSALVDAGVELARSGGPDAVVLREVTRMVGVVPNAAYRHFADRDALIAAVRDEAVGAPAPGRRKGIPGLRPQRAGPVRHRVRGSRPPDRGDQQRAATTGIPPGRTRRPRPGRRARAGAPAQDRIPHLGHRPRARGPPPRTPTRADRPRQRS